jgi:hypothetical protein
MNRSEISHDSQKYAASHRGMIIDVDDPKYHPVNRQDQAILANIEPVAAFDGNRQFSSIYERRTVD